MFQARFKVNLKPSKAVLQQKVFISGPWEYLVPLKMFYWECFFGIKWNPVPVYEKKKSYLVSPLILTPLHAMKHFHLACKCKHVSIESDL